MSVLNPSDFSDIITIEPYFHVNETSIQKKKFEASSSVRLLGKVNACNNVNFCRCVFSNLNWKGQTVRKAFSFEGCLFKGGQTSFENVVFEEDVSFNNCVFEDTVNFDNVVFKKNASFQNIHTVGSNQSQFLFRGCLKTEPFQNCCQYRLDFSNAEFENAVFFNERNFNQSTFFNETKFINLFYFDNAKLGSQTYFINPKYSCVQYLEKDDLMKRSMLIRCFDNLIHCMEESHQDAALEKKIKESICGAEEFEQIEQPENEFVSFRYVLKYTNWKSSTLSSYTKRYPEYFEKIGCGRNRMYNFKKIKSFLSLSSKDKQKVYVLAEAIKNKKAGCHYANLQRVA